MGKTEGKNTQKRRLFHNQGRKRNSFDWELALATVPNMYMVTLSVTSAFWDKHCSLRVLLRMGQRFGEVVTAHVSAPSDLGLINSKARAFSLLCSSNLGQEQSLHLVFQVWFKLWQVLCCKIGKYELYLLVRSVPHSSFSLFLPITVPYFWWRLLIPTSFCPSSSASISQNM